MTKSEAIGAAKAISADYLSEVSKALGAVNGEDLAAAVDAVLRAIRAEATIFVAGNGGNAATASHIVNDLMKSVRAAGVPRLRAISLGDNSALMTATANDETFAQIFSLPLSQMAREGDLLFVLSASGNSPNIIEALKAAASTRLTTVGFYGMGGGAAKSLTDFPVIVESYDYGVTEDVQSAMCHALAAVARKLFE
jgi:D-sedoheptulose 7-phosphate isomerase